MPPRRRRRRRRRIRPTKTRPRRVGDGWLGGGVASALQATLCDLEVVDRKLTRLEVICEVEALGEHGLHHEAHLLVAIVAAQAAAGGDLVLVALALDIEVLASSP